MNRDNLIITSVISNEKNRKYDNILISFILSLRKLGKYNDDITVICSGKFKDKIECFLKDNNINFVYVKNDYESYDIVNSRFFFILDFLCTNTNYKCIACYDCDFWFQNNINILFEKINKLEGCLYARDSYRKNPWLKGAIFKNIKQKKIIIEKMNKIMKHYGSTINGGFFAGRTPAMIEKILKIKQILLSDNVRKTYGADQYIQNYLFEFGKDNASGRIFNTMAEKVNKDFKRKNNRLFVNDNNEIKEIIGVHYARTGRMIKENCFEYLYPDIINEYKDFYI